MKSSIAVLLVGLFVVATLAQDEQQNEMQTKINQLKTQLSSRFADLQKKVSQGVEDLKAKSPELKAQLEDMQTNLQKAADEAKPEIDAIGTQLQSMANKAKESFATFQATNQPQIQAAQVKASGWMDNLKTKFSNWFDNQA